MRRGPGDPAGIGLLALAGMAGAASCSSAGGPTFTDDVAPIVRDHCAACHQPGGVAPFSLLTYADVRRRARQIVHVTSTRFMPPWLPEPSGLEFRGERRLSEAQIETLRAWTEAGMPRGEGRDEPVAAVTTGAWPLGPPDRVVRMSDSYTLPAAGPDLFRNFVIPISVGSARWVRAIDLRPGDPRVVHHAVMGIDRTGASRRRDAAEPGPGFEGMDMGGAEGPQGIFLAWTPGKLPHPGTAGMAWRLARGDDLVVQLHLVPSGKPEPIQIEVGLYFTDEPPTLAPSILMLSSFDIDIPPGESDYVVEDELRLPVPVRIVGVYPHAHYLGRRLEGGARLPDGGELTLLRIPDWDFNWQDDYRYREQVELPAGTLLTMRYVFDNSAANPRNPNDPPRRVVAGNRSSDEMATLLYQVLTRDEDDRLALREAAEAHYAAKNPLDQRAHHALGRAVLARGRADRAMRHFRRALELDPRYAAAHHGLGLALDRRGQPQDAERAYRTALHYDPDLATAHNDLGSLLLARGETEAAMRHLETAIRLDADLAMAHYNLGVALAGRDEYRAAVECYREALAIDPQHAMGHNNLGAAYHLLGRLEDAMRHYRRALELDPALPDAHNNLGYVLAVQQRYDEAIEHYRRALELAPSFETARANLEAALAGRERAGLE